LPVFVTVTFCVALMVPFAQFPNARESGLTVAVRVGATAFAVIVTGAFVTVAFPAIATDPVTGVAPVGVEGATHCTRIVHDVPASSVRKGGAGPAVGQLPVTPVMRVRPVPVTVPVPELNTKAVVPLLETVRSRVVVVLTTALKTSGAGFTTTSVLLAAIWYSTAPTSAGFVEILGRGLPKKSVAGAPVLVPRLTADDVPAIEYAPPVAATDAEATISSGAVGVVALGRLRVKGP